MGDVVQILETRAECEPDRRLYGFLDARGNITDTYTYREFHRRSNHLAASLAAGGSVEPDRPVLLVYPPGLEFAVAFFACAKLGAIPVPVPPPVGPGGQGGLEKLSHIACDAGASLALTDSNMLRRLSSITAGGNIDFSLLGAKGLEPLTWLATDEIVGELDRFEPTRRPVLFLQYTSGSTREPRGVVVSHDNIIHNCALALDHDQPVGVSWLPHFHDMGLIGYYLWSVVRGGTAYCLSPLDFLRRPAAWFEAISHYKATITTVPNFAFDYCLRRDKVPDTCLDGFDLSSIQQLINAAEPVRAASVNRFLDRFSTCGLNAKALSAAYGLAEHTLCVTGGGRVQITVNKRLIERNQLRVEAGPENPARSRCLVSCGKAGPGVDLRIVDPATRLSKGPGEIGEIWVDSGSKAGGYWQQPDVSRSVFEALVSGEDGAQSYLRTGDIGFLHEGELFVCGRLKDMIVVRGQNIFPNDLEAMIETTIPAITPGSAVAFADKQDADCEGVVVLIEVKGTGGLPGLADVMRDIQKACPVPVRLVALVPRGSVVRTSSGKISRALTSGRWLSGKLNALDVFEAAAEIRSGRTADECLEDIFQIAAQRGDDGLTLEQLGLDSFELVTLSLHLEEFVETNDLLKDHLSLNMNDLRIIQSITIGQLRALISQVTSPNMDIAEIERFSAHAVQEATRAEDALIECDAVLAADIVAGPLRSVGEEGILITGATGFLGAYLLGELLQQTDRMIHVLVRAQDEEHGRNRIEAALRSTGALRTVAAADLWQRLKIVPGDLREPRLGLAPEVWDGLSTNVSAIYHCGAEVDYVKSYRAMRRANVQGTGEIIRLATTGPPKRLHYVSTTFIFGWCALPVLYERAHDGGMEDRDFGYAQTKWVAEQLVYQAVDRGLDARIYRSSLVTASRAGHYMRGDIVARILGYMIRYGISTDARNQMSFLPVDHCAQNIAAISLIDDLESVTFHVTADDHYAIADVCDFITGHFGYRFDYRSMDGFVAHMNAHCGPDDELFPLKPFIAGHVDRVNLMQDKRYHNDSYRAARRLAVSAQGEPSLGDIVKPIIHFLRAEQLVPALPSDPDLVIAS